MHGEIKSDHNGLFVTRTTRFCSQECLSTLPGPKQETNFTIAINQDCLNGFMDDLLFRLVLFGHHFPHVHQQIRKVRSTDPAETSCNNLGRAPHKLHMKTFAKDDFANKRYYLSDKHSSNAFVIRLGLTDGLSKPDAIRCKNSLHTANVTSCGMKLPRKKEEKEKEEDESKRPQMMCNSEPFQKLQSPCAVL